MNLYQIEVSHYLRYIVASDSQDGRVDTAKSDIVLSTNPVVNLRTSWKDSTCSWCWLSVVETKRSSIIKNGPSHLISASFYAVEYWRVTSIEGGRQISPLNCYCTRSHDCDWESGHSYRCSRSCHSQSWGKRPCTPIVLRIYFEINGASRVEGSRLAHVVGESLNWPGVYVVPSLLVVAHLQLIEDRQFASVLRV